jgi:hypothetical protein
MTGLPTSLAGMIGFIIFVVFIVAITVPSINSRDTETIKTLQSNYQQNSTVNSTSLNQSVGFWGFIGNVTGLNGIYDFIVGFFQMIINFIKLALAYLGIFTNVFSQVPSVFYIIFLVLASSLVIGLIKLIFLSGD